MRHKKLLGILLILSILVVAIFLFTNLNMQTINFVMPRRIRRVTAIILTAGTIAFSSTVFQTITNNRILTPSIMGLDSLYLLIQTILIFVFGSMNVAVIDRQVNFLLSVGIMVFFSMILFKVLFKSEGKNIFYLLLIGMIFGTLFGSFSTFMQVLIDPNEFFIVQNRMFASFNNVDTEILGISILLIGAIILFSYKDMKQLDVISLGREEAINLGVPYDKVVKKFLFMVAILVAISTALVGPITFLGLLVVNLARELMKTYKHTYLIWGSVLIGVIALVGGQLIVERVFTFATTISVIINFVGGVYFIYLLLKENRSW